MEITEKMIKAGKDAYWGHFVPERQFEEDRGAEGCFTEQIIAIFNAMIEADCQCQACLDSVSRQCDG